MCELDNEELSAGLDKNAFVGSPSPGATPVERGLSRATTTIRSTGCRSLRLRLSRSPS